MRRDLIKKMARNENKYVERTDAFARDGDREREGISSAFDISSNYSNEFQC
jgi:hypothetical protein